ncbi:conserved protein, unknown function, partial [Hepatocystis sp. ex Piliocolobus tephrosceles]
MEQVKILYLHIVDDKRTKRVRSMLEENYGKNNVICCKDENYKTDLILVFLVYFICTSFVILITLICYYFNSFIYTFILPLIIIYMTIFFIGSIIFNEIIYYKYLKKSNILYEKHKPNVMVGYEAGCTLAMHLDGPKVPMVKKKKK